MNKIAKEKNQPISVIGSSPLTSKLGSEAIAKKRSSAKPTCEDPSLATTREDQQCQGGNSSTIQPECNDRQASRWLKETGRSADIHQAPAYFLPPVSIERIVNYAKNKKNRQKDLRWAGVIAAIMLGATIFLWYQNRFDWEMTHSSWPAHTRRVMFQDELE